VHKHSRLLLFLIPYLLKAQPSVDLQQAFLDISNDAVLMCVSAHPDDEDGASLAYYGMKYGVKTYSVFMTRGEGGQNEKGPELYEDLGVLRSAETQAAGRIQGTEVHFLNFKDFGYSKSATEAFHKWGRDEVLRRLVYIIRKVKPDVIFSSLNPVDGHGHHQATANAAIAAFDAAADSTYAPEQLRLPGITVWQPKKFFIRNVNRPEFGFNDWGRCDVVVNLEEMNDARQTAYLDIAANALRMHKTQGMERADLRRFARGRNCYKMIRASSLFDRDTTTFFGGIDLWSDHLLAPLVPLRRALSTLRIGMPQDSLLTVASELLGQVRSLQKTVNATALAQRILMHWQEGLEKLARLSCNISLRFALADTVVVPRQRVNCTLEIGSKECKISGVKQEFSVPPGWSISEAVGSAPVLDQHRYVHDFSLVVGEAPVLTLPKAVAQYRPIEAEQDVRATISCTVSGHPFTFSTHALFDVAPPQTFAVSPTNTRIAPAQLSKGKTFEYTITNCRPGEMTGKVVVQCPVGWRSESESYRIQAEDSTTHGTITIRAAKDTKPGEYVLKFKTEYAVQEVAVKVFDVAVAEGSTVGIVKSYDNTLEAALKEIGVPCKLIDGKELEVGDLSSYSTIIIDIRAYLVREDLTKNSNRLLQYAKDGGNLVVMYQRSQEWKPEYAPYPFDISNNRVTDEDAQIDVLESEHPLLNHPNRIDEADWQGWKQERGLYFPKNVPHEYTLLLSTHDPDELEQKTGYIVAQYGKGTYIYTSYVWYRQLKETNPGAFRCFANMISYPDFRK
jgi:LmbE family N-acetylglucosaminyl deacetylase